MALLKRKGVRGRANAELRAKADARRAARLQQVRDALQYRLAGYTHQQIAQFMTPEGKRPLAPDTISGWIKEALAETIEEPSDHLRQIELDRLDMLFQAYWPTALGAPDPTTGAQRQPNSFHASMVLQITNMRWRLMGLGAPQQIDITSRGEKIQQGAGLSGLLEAARAGKVPDAEMVLEGEDAGRRSDQDD